MKFVLDLISRIGGQKAVRQSFYKTWFEGLVTHNRCLSQSEQPWFAWPLARCILISPDGHLVHLWKSNVWTPYEVHRMIEESVFNSTAVAKAR